MGQKNIIDSIISFYPDSYADQLKINVSRNTPAPLYRWLVCSLLFSARISSDLAIKAAKAIFDQGWRTPAKMAATTWEERVKVLNSSGYARYDESTARYIADTTNLLIEKYDGDLRKLREEAEQSPKKERELLKQFKGIGDVGVDIFFRQVQLAWDELYPIADTRSLNVAKQLGLPHDAEKLAGLMNDREELPKLLAGLNRARNANLSEIFGTKVVQSPER